MVAVPILGRAGGVIGVVVLHTEAPREFEDDVLNSWSTPPRSRPARSRTRSSTRRRAGGWRS